MWLRFDPIVAESFLTRNRWRIAPIAYIAQSDPGTMSIDCASFRRDELVEVPDREIKAGISARRLGRSI